VQNAYEIIKSIVFEDLRKANSRQTQAASVIDEFADALEKTKKFRVAIALFLLRQTAKDLRDEETALDIFKKRDMDVVWIEHWPRRTGLLDAESDYYIVVEDEGGSPNWNRINVARVAAELGYSASRMEKDESIFSAAQSA
jgi:hypothetical protein